MGAQCFWCFGIWNVRSMLDNEGLIEVARQGPACHQLSEDCRVDLVIRKVQHYDISVAALQETKWFDIAVYVVGRSTVLAAAPSPPPPPSPDRACREARVWHMSSFNQQSLPGRREVSSGRYGGPGSSEPHFQQ